MRTHHRRHICFISLLSLSLACTAKQPETQIEPQPKPPEITTGIVTPEPKPEPEVTTANVPLDPPPSEPKLPPVDGFFMAQGAPSPRGCTKASDCSGNTMPDVDNPCCQNPYTLEAHAWPYRTWLNAWREDHCAGVTCPPPPNPSQPPACAFEVDCVQGQCVDACK